jgi:hypothetical protein
MRFLAGAKGISPEMKFAAEAKGMSPEMRFPVEAAAAATAAAVTAAAVTTEAAADSEIAIPVFGAPARPTAPIANGVERTLPSSGSVGLPDVTTDIPCRDMGVMSPVTNWR